MRSLLSDVMAAFDNVYSGWIIWNLFLAFIPLVLSVLLFRRRAIAQPWLWGLCGGVGCVGVIGFVPRYDHWIRAAKGVVQSALSGQGIALLKLSLLASLAIVGAGLIVWLLRLDHPLPKSMQTVVWWAGFAAFIAFLPNAPYMLTDIIHLIRGTSLGAIPIWVVALVFIPIHVVAILLGFEAYVLSLLNQDYYLKQHSLKDWTLPAELSMHALSAIGIYLGRFIRFNSWDVVSDPSSVLLVTLNTVTEKRPLAVMVVTFIILTVFYWVMKQITLGLKLRMDYARRGQDVLL